MALYDIVVQRPDRLPVSHYERAFPDLASVWDHIADIALDIDESGARILVIDESGDAIISVGVATARASASSDRMAA